MLQGEARAGNLTLARFAAQLLNQLGALGEAGRPQRVSLRQQPPRGIGHDATAVGIVAISDELLGAAVRTQAQPLVDEHLVLRKAVVEFDDIEIPDAEKKPFAHNVKSKVEINGTEIKMFRQNRAIGTAKEHGTMFVGFAAEASTLTTSLRQMITADADGNYDHLLDFVTATTGAMYFVPPQAFLDAITG